MLILDFKSWDFTYEIIEERLLSLVLGLWGEFYKLSYLFTKFYPIIKSFGFLLIFEYLAFF